MTKQRETITAERRYYLEQDIINSLIVFDEHAQGFQKYKNPAGYIQYKDGITDATIAKQHGVGLKIVANARKKIGVFFGAAKKSAVRETIERLELKVKELTIMLSDTEARMTKLEALVHQTSARTSRSVSDFSMAELEEEQRRISALNR